MAAEEGRGALGVCRRFLRAYIEAQNLELVAHCLHESVELLVDGQRGMPVRGRNEVCRALMRCRPMQGSGFVLADDTLSRSALVDDCDIVMGKLLLRPRDGGHEQVVALTAVLVRRGGEWLLRALHVAMGAGCDGADDWRTLLDGAPCAVGLIDSSGGMTRATYCNRRMRELLGVRNVDAQSRPRAGEVALERMLNGRDAPELKRALRRLFAFEPGAGHTGECVECDGLNVALIPLRPGRAGVYARPNANFDRHSVEPLGMCGGYVEFEFICGLARRLYTDAGVRRLGGYCARDYGLAGAAQLAAEVHPDDVEAFEQLFDQLCAGVDAASLSYRMRLKDGNYRRVHFSAIRRGGASERRYTGVYIDVARVAGAEASLAQSESAPAMSPIEAGAPDMAGIFGDEPDVHAARGEVCAAGSDGPSAYARVHAVDAAGAVRERAGGAAPSACAGSVDGAVAETELLERCRLLVEGEAMFTFDYYPALDELHYCRRDGSRLVQRVMRNYLKFVLRDSGIHPDYVAGYLRALRQACSAPGRGKLELMYLWQGEYRWVRMSYCGIAGADGAVERLACRVDDARAERSHDCQLNARVACSDAYRRAFSQGAVLAMTFDLTTGCRVDTGADVMPDALKDQTTLDDVIRLLRERLAHPDDRRDLTQACLRCAGALDGRPSVRIELECRLALDGCHPDAYRWTRLTLAATSSADGARRWSFICAFDIDRRKRRELYYERQARLERLTGLMNGAAMREACARLEFDGAPDGVERALVVARLEYPELSAEAGSRLLLAAADALRALRHERELICRFERDEFGLMAEVHGGEGVLRERLRIISVALNAVAAHEPRVNVWLGAAVAPRDGRDIDELYGHAVRALTWARARARERFAIYAGGVDGALTGAQTGALSGQARAYVRTLGGFELFAGGKAVLFSSAKAREMLALLVDRGGGFMTHEELIARLWPGEPVNALTLARCRKIAMRLKNTLREYGVEDIVEAAKSRRRIAAERVEFDFARANEYDMPHGEYMKGYAWAKAHPAALKLREEPGE